MKVLTPCDDLAFPIQRSDGMLHKVLRSGEGYLIADSTAAFFEQRIRAGLTSATITEAVPPPFTFSPSRILTFFEGEFGDAVCVEPAVRVAESLPRGAPLFGFVTRQDDHDLYPDTCAVFDYPITLRQAQHYDCWVEFDARACSDEGPCAAFARRVPGATGVGPMMLSRPHRFAPYSDPVRALLPEGGRPRVALCAFAESHYRSWRADKAFECAALLAEAECDCFIIGPAKRKLVFQEPSGRPVQLWTQGIYDASGLLTSARELIAFLTMMDLVIACDGGTLQVACALQRPCLGLFGPTRSEAVRRNAPYLTGLDSDTCQGAPCWCRGDECPARSEHCDAMLGHDPRVVAETAITIEKKWAKCPLRIV